MTAPVLDIHKILKKLPHRYPFLLVDRVLALEKGKSIQALKNVTIKPLQSIRSCNPYKSCIILHN